jgi:hypothetical protein
MIAGFEPGCIKNASDLADALELVILDLFKGSLHTFTVRDTPDGPSTMIVTVDADDAEEQELVIWIGTEDEMADQLLLRLDRPSKN